MIKLTENQREAVQAMLRGERSIEALRQFDRVYCPPSIFYNLQKKGVVEPGSAKGWYKLTALGREVAQ